MNWWVRNWRKTDNINDLGVIHDRALNSHAHLEAAFSKAHKALGFISRNTSDFTNNETFKVLIHYIGATAFKLLFPDLFSVLGRGLQLWNQCNISL